MKNAKAVICPSFHSRCPSPPHDCGACLLIKFVLALGRAMYSRKESFSSYCIDSTDKSLGRVYLVLTCDRLADSVYEEDEFVRTPTKLKQKPFRL